MIRDDEKVWAESEIFSVLSGLMAADNALPWWARWLMRPWNQALGAAASALCPNKVTEIQQDEALRDFLQE